MTDTFELKANVYENEGIIVTFKHVCTCLSNIARNMFWPYEQMTVRN